MNAKKAEATLNDAVPDADLISSGVEGTAMDQVRGWAARVRGGEVGALPAILGLIFVFGVFWATSEYFMTERNFANLLTQAAPLVMLAMALVFVILLGEIDLSAGVTWGTTAAIFVVLTETQGWNWIAALLFAFMIGIAIGTLIGFFVALVGIPSFVVSLGLFLGLQGVQLWVIGEGGLYRVQTSEVLAIQNNNMEPWMGWALLALVLAVVSATDYVDRRRRARAGVPNRIITLVWIKLGVIAVAGALLVNVLNQDRGSGIIPVQGVPIVVPIVLAILWIGTFVLDRTRFGRYIYAIGGNPEAARRSGVKVVAVRWTAFLVTSSLAVVAGLFSVSKVGSVDASAGRVVVLSAVAAAVVGGVSLFGGRGRLAGAAIGALLITVITNGLGLLNFDAGVNFMATGFVLVAAATIDALSRRRGGTPIGRSN